MAVASPPLRREDEVMLLVGVGLGQEAECTLQNQSIRAEEFALKLLVICSMITVYYLKI